MSTREYIGNRPSFWDRVKSFIYTRSDGSQYTGPGNEDDDDYSESPLATAEARKALANAKGNPVVCATINWITDQATTTPFVMERRPTDGDIETDNQHPLLLLLRNPSPHMSGKELLSVSIWDMLVYGQCFWHKDNLRNGRIAQLTFLPARKVTVKGSATELVTEYEYSPGDSPPATYPPEEIVHIRIEPNPDDPKNGLSPLTCASLDMAIINKAATYTLEALEGAGAPGGFLMPPPEAFLTDEEAKAIANYAKKEFAKSKRGSIGVSRAYLEYKATGLSPQSIGMGSLQDKSTEFICGVLGVHPVILGLGAGNAQSRVGAATASLETAAWTNRIIPLTDTIAEQIARQLMPDFIEEDELLEWIITLDRSAVPALQPDLLREAQRLSVLARAGLIDRYDAKESQGLDASEDFDRFYVLNAGTIFVPSDQPPPPPAAPAPPPGPEDEEGDEQDPENDEDGEEEDGDETPPVTEEEERGFVAGAILKMARSKAELDQQQRALMIALAQDAERLVAIYTPELHAALSALGEMAEEAFWAVNGQSTVRATIRGTTEKQTQDEINAEVHRILAAMNISQWEQAVLIPAWDGHTLRTLNITVGSVNSTLGLGVNIPDPVAREVVRLGGTRRGLIDFTEQSRRALFQTLFEGRSRGDGPLQLAQSIQNQVPAGPFQKAGSAYRAELIARTETRWAQNVSTMEVYKAADTVTSVLIVDAQLGDTDEICMALDGQELSFAEAEAIEPLQHPNCTRSFSPVVRRPGS